MDQVIKQVSGAIHSASLNFHADIVWGALHILTQLKERPKGLGREAYRWCAVIWNNGGGSGDREDLLLLSLEVGFRHIRPPDSWYFPLLLPNSVELHRGVSNTILKSNNSEAIEDLAWASFTIDRSGLPWLKTLANYIIDLNEGGTETFPPCLRRPFIYCVEWVGSDTLKDVGSEIFVKLLNCLHIGIEDLEVLRRDDKWAAIILEIIRSAEGAQNLAIQSWKFLAELVSEEVWNNVTCDPDVTTRLVSGAEWDKLEYWMSVVWMAKPPEPGHLANELGGAMELLEEENPGALQQWMERWSEKPGREVPAWFQQIYAALAR